MITKFGSPTSGMGDLLLLTSICKYFPNKLTIQLPSSKEKYSILFKGLANIEITECIYELPSLGWGHYSTRKLRNFFSSSADLLDNRPLVLYSDIESEKWSFDYLKDKPNPVIVVPNCSKEWALVRNMPKTIVEENILNLKSNGFTPILIINKENKYETDYIHQLENLELKKYICLLRKIGLYVGCNTGDEHLAVAVGCSTNVFQPKDGNGFNSIEWNYRHINNKYFLW
jgi:hypothetical protein